MHAMGAAICRSWQKHVLAIPMAFGLGLIAVEADNDAEVFSTRSRTRSLSNILWLGRACAGAKAPRENSTVRREL
jgi:hypothetical protein